MTVVRAFQSGDPVGVVTVECPKCHHVFADGRFVCDWCKVETEALCECRRVVLDEDFALGHTRCRICLSSAGVEAVGVPF